MISVQALTKTHPGSARPVLDAVTFDVATGALVAILGKSGSGKSTLLRCIVGLEAVDGGTVQLHGAPARRGELGLVFQSFELFPHLSALENCMLAPMKAQGLPRPEAREQACGLLTQLGLAERMDAFPEQLSGGQRQRVAIARALATRPGALLYDEPTSALDPAFKEEVLNTLREVKASGVTQIVVTHDLALAEQTDEILVLEEGRLRRGG